MTAFVVFSVLPVLLAACSGFVLGLVLGYASAFQKMRKDLSSAALALVEAKRFIEKSRASIEEQYALAHRALAQAEEFVIRVKGGEGK